MITFRFEEMLKRFQHQYGTHKEEKYRKFATYLEYYTGDRKQFWPKCYAHGAPNTNMSLEHFHSDFSVN